MMRSPTARVLRRSRRPWKKEEQGRGVRLGKQFLTALGDSFREGSGGNLRSGLAVPLGPTLPVR